MADRLPKIDELIRQQLGQIILSEVELPFGSLVTINKVKTSKDLSQAKIFISILPEENKDKILKLLIREAKNLRQVLGEKIVLRSLPRIKFFLDETENRALEIEQLLDNLK